MKPPRLDLNPSSAERWTTCTASPQFILDNWNRVCESDTPWNQEGTTAHEVAASYLQNREPREGDKYHCPVPVTPDMLWFGWMYAEYVEGLREPGSRLLVEQKLPLWYMPGRNAIVDAAVITQHSLHVVDYKYGEGIIVSTERNLQAVIYAKAVASKVYRIPPCPDFPVFLHIYQPRGRAAEDSPFHVWETTWGEIEEIAKVIEEAANLIQRPGFLPFDPKLTFAPSEKACQWCPAKGFCTARPAMLLDGIEVLKPAATELATLPELPAVKAVSIEQLAAIVESGEGIIKWVKDAQAYALDFMKAGNKLPGHKLVLSRGGNRYWSSPKEVEKVLLEETILRREDIVEEKLIGPAAVEKLIGKNKLPINALNLISKPPGQLVIAREDDTRASAFIDAKEEFDDVSTGGYAIGGKGKDA